MEQGRSFEGLPLDLGRELRARGHGDLAAALLEVVPDGGWLRDDAERALLAERLRRIAAADRVARRFREEAAHLADLAVAADPAARRGRTGQIWIAWNGQDYDDTGDFIDEHELPEPGYEVSWEADRGEQWVEDGPYFISLRDALTWSRDRTDAVIVRPAWDERTYYWAGRGHIPTGFPPLDESRA